MKTNAVRVLMLSALAGAALILPQTARSHCDTMDGPVVQSAKIALVKQDVTPVLKWVTKDREAEVRGAFAKTLAVRAKGAEARELADQFFFETLVRVHRAGEGEPFAGLKPAGTNPGPEIVAADKALAKGSVDPVVKLVSDDAAAGIRQRFAEVREKQKHAEDSVEAGREYVAAYVAYVHYVEGMHEAARGVSAHHEPAAAKTESAAHGDEHQH